MDCITYPHKSNQRTPDFVLRISLDGRAGYYMWGIKKERKTLTFTKDYGVGYEPVDLDIPNVL